jgi:radical SAM superfamily enzyme YgiQ (UPF0313 family)
MYRSKDYTINSDQNIYDQIDSLSQEYPDATKVFLADGDVFGINTDRLIKILEYIKKSFSKLRRISAYGSTQNIQNKSLDELKLLQENRLNLIYYGIESGSDTILQKIKKGVNSDEIIQTLNKLSDANIKISATVILGLGGIAYSREHILHTANIINQTKINYLSTLQLMLDDDIKEVFFQNFRDYFASSDYDIINEQRDFIEQLNPNNNIIFRSNHASNAIHLEGIIPKDKNKLIDQLDISKIMSNEIVIPMKYRGF